MAHDLQDRLHDLADRTPPAVPPADLWTRGLRRRRVGQAVTSLTVLVLVLLVGAGGLAWRKDASRIEPVASQGAPHLPDRIYEPSPWLPAFDGPPGQLVALLTAERKSLLHTTTGLVGVTASTGEYGFLDLPDALEGAVLSPDGRRVAYWASGPTSGDPHTVADGKAIGALTIYDTETGHVVTHRVETAHGLQPNELIWTAAGSVFFEHSQQLGGDADSEERQSMSNDATAGLWNVRTGALTPLPLGFYSVASAPGAPLVLSGGNDDSYRVQTRPDSSQFRAFRWVGTSASAPSITFSPDQGLFAGLSNGAHGAERSPSKIAGGPVVPPPWPDAHVVKARLVPHSGQTFQVLGWLDGQHVAALRRNPVGDAPEISMRVDSIDIRSGRSRTLVSHLASNYPTLQVATDLLSAPTAHASPPPKPWDLRWVIGGTVFCLLVLGFFVWGMRRGRRA